MDRVEEIEKAIVNLTPEEFQRLSDWLRAREQGRWEEEIERDSAAGNLDFLFNEAEDEAARGLLRDWPPRG
jgi:hypothetical protein